MPDLMQSLHQSGKIVQCQQQDCIWLDIGRPDDYASAQQIFENKRSLFLKD